MTDLSQKVAYQHLIRLAGTGRWGQRVASAALQDYDSLVDAMEEEPELMGQVLESLASMGYLSYQDGALHYREARHVSAETKHDQSIALMRFLAKESKRLGVGEHVYVVGGAVRNFVIDRPIKDIDVVIDSVALRGKDSDWFAKKLQQAIPAKTSLKTNQYGVAILAVNESWVVDGEELQGEVIEIANARKESYGGEGGKGYKPHMVEPSTIEEDIGRREFTFNTLLWQLSELAQGPDKAEIIDLTGCGLRDLEEGVMKCPSNPDKTFSDDPTRMLRAVKFLVKYGFKIHPEVAQAIRRNARKIKKAPQNAIADILVNDILEMSQSKKVLKVLGDLGLLAEISDLLEQDKAFRATLANWARGNAKVVFLFDMMDVGLPLYNRLHFLDDAQMAVLRQIALEMDERDASAFVDMLKQPGKVMDTAQLIKEFDLKGRQVADLMDTARDVLLDNPALRKNTRKLTDAVGNRFR